MRSKVLMGMILALGLASGCEKKEEPTSPTTQQPSQTITAVDANKAVPDAKAIEDAKAKADADAAKAIEDAKAKADADAAKVIEDAKAKADAEAAKAAEAAGVEATSQIEKIQSLISGGKLADAETLLKALEDKLATFAPGIQEKIKALRTAITAKKAAESLKIPSLPK